MTLRVGIIGCGAIAWGHALGWTACPDTTLVGIADPVKAARDSLGDAFGVDLDHRYETREDLLDAEPLDVVSICTWASDHHDSMLAALARKPKLILCEKPIATCLGDAQAMRSAAARAGVPFAVSYQRRFYPGWEEARTQIRGGVIGEPRQVTMKVSDGLVNNGSHSIDMIRFLLDDADIAWVLGSAQRNTDRHERGARVEDSAIALMETTGGARIFLECGCTDELPTANASIVGTEGVLDVVEDKVVVLNGAAGGWKALRPSASTTVEPELAANPGFISIAGIVNHLGAAESRAFARLFASQGEALVDWMGAGSFRGEAANATAALEAVMAIFESTRVREPVRLPLQTRADPLEVMVEAGDLPVTRPGRYDIRLFAQKAGTGV